MELIFGLIVAITLGIIPAMIANSKGHSPLPWFFYGFLIFPIALTHSILIKAADKSSETFIASETFVGKIRIWDIPTRLFHWILVLAIALLFATGIEGGNWIDCHATLGLVVVGLLAFRLVWGVIGSTYARFIQFFPTPFSIIAYLQGKWHGQGHNPLGALSVFALLSLTLAQTLTGLFSNDEISFYGPLYKLVDSSISLKLTGLHHALAYYGLALFVGLHVASIVLYWLLKKDNLFTPMLTGRKEVPPGDADKGYKGGGFVAFLVALSFALLAVWGASGEWIPEPPPPAAVETPSW